MDLGHHEEIGLLLLIFDNWLIGGAFLISLMLSFNWNMQVQPPSSEKRFRALSDEGHSARPDSSPT